MEFSRVSLTYVSAQGEAESSISEIKKDFRVIEKSDYQRSALASASVSRPFFWRVYAKAQGTPILVELKSDVFD